MEKWTWISFCVFHVQCSHVEAITAYLWHSKRLFVILSDVYLQRVLDRGLRSNCIIFIYTLGNEVGSAKSLCRPEHIGLVYFFSMFYH